MASGDARLHEAIREALAASPGLGALGPEAIEHVAAELAPFLDAVATATDDDPLPREARSLVYLFAWRLGDQGLPAPAPLSAILAWRDLDGSARAQRATDLALPLVVEGYTRAREDRIRETVLTRLAATLPVVELAPEVTLVVAAGPLDTDAAQRLTARASPALLRWQTRVLVLDLTGLDAPNDGVLTELWSLVDAARLLGAATVLVATPSQSTALTEARLPLTDVHPVPSLAEAMETIARKLGLPLVRAQGWFGFAHGLLARAAAKRPDRTHGG
jgi:anti-anti-sigma regulatory factor